MAWRALPPRQRWEAGDGSGGRVAEKESGQINTLCQRCVRFCKQPASMLLLSCPRYQKRPFAVEKLRFEQLDLFERRD